jgi:hypothetical protein
VSEDIFDYFAGNSARKIEPIEDDEFMGGSGSSETAKEPIVASRQNEPDDIEYGRQDPESRTDTTRVQPTNVGSTENVHPSTEDTIPSHWDLLASSLGVESSTPTPPPAQSSVRRTSSKSSFKSKSRRGSMAKEKEAIPPKSHSSFGFGIFPTDSTETDQTVDQPNLLSELFVPSIGDFDAPDETENRAMEDRAMEDDEIVDEALIEREFAERTGPSVADIPEAADDDFVQFEIEELEYPEEAESKERRPRRRRRRGNKDSQLGSHSPTPIADSNKRDASGNRNRSSRDKQTDEARRSAELDRESLVEPSALADALSDFDSDRDDSLSSEDRDVDGISEKSAHKRPKFPTWDEAIGGMIESNIQTRHSGGRGGRRRGR